MKGDFATAASLYGELVAAKPDDRNLVLTYGEALLGAGRYKEAPVQFAPLKGKAGARDLGVPAVKASMLAGDSGGAVASIASIPKQYRPMSLKDDPVFAPLKTARTSSRCFNLDSPACGPRACTSPPRSRRRQGTRSVR